MRLIPSLALRQEGGGEGCQCCISAARLARALARLLHQCMRPVRRQVTLQARDLSLRSAGLPPGQPRQPWDRMAQPIDPMIDLVMVSVLVVDGVIGKDDVEGDADDEVVRLVLFELSLVQGSLLVGVTDGVADSEAESEG